MQRLLSLCVKVRKRPYWILLLINIVVIFCCWFVDFFACMIEQDSYPQPQDRESWTLTIRPPCLLLPIFTNLSLGLDIHVEQLDSVIAISSDFQESLIHTNAVQLSNTAPPSKNAVSAFQISTKLLSFTLKNSWRN